MKADTMTKLTKQQLDDISAALQDDKRGLLQSEQRQLLAHAEAVQAELAQLQAEFQQYINWAQGRGAAEIKAAYQRGVKAGQASYS